MGGVRKGAINYECSTRLALTHTQSRLKSVASCFLPMTRKSAKTTASSPPIRTAEGKTREPVSSASGWEEGRTWTEIGFARKGEGWEKEEGGGEAGVWGDCLFSRGQTGLSSSVINLHYECRVRPPEDMKPGGNKGQSSAWSKDECVRKVSSGTKDTNSFPHLSRPLFSPGCFSAAAGRQSCLRPPCCPSSRGPSAPRPGRCADLQGSRNLRSVPQDPLRWRPPGREREKSETWAASFNSFHGAACARVFPRRTFGFQTTSLCTLRPAERWLNVTRVYALHKTWQLDYNVGETVELKRIVFERSNTPTRGTTLVGKYTNRQHQNDNQEEKVAQNHRRRRRINKSCVHLTTCSLMLTVHVLFRERSTATDP